MATKDLKAQQQQQDPKTIAEEDDNEEERIAEIVLPTDSGWAWVVMIAAFCCTTIIDGVVFSSGLIQEPIAAEFNVGKSTVAWVSSLLSGFYLIAGPFVSAMANRFGFRKVTIAGSIFSAICFAISYFAPSVEFLYITYGVLAGIGFSMVYIPAVVIVGFYFEKYRALATGIAMCGSGIGTIIFAPLTKAISKSIGWRGCLAVQAGIILICVLLGLTFRPLEPVKLAVSKESAQEEDEEKRKLNGHANAPSVNPKFNVQVYAKPLPEGRFAYSMPNSAHNTYMGQSPKHHYPTAAEVFRGANLERRPSSGRSGTEMKLLRKSQPTTPNGEPQQQQLTFNLNKELSPVGENEEETENENLLETAVKPIIVQGRRHTVSGRRPQDLLKKNLGSQDAVHHSSSRPMYRDDIFFTGSLARIPQYQSQTSLAYHLSVTRLPTKTEMLEERQSGCRCCPESVRRMLSTMLDTELLRSPSFLLLAISGFLTMMGFFVPFVFVVGRAKENGIDENAAVLLISGIGLINTVARVVCGMISSFPAVKPLWLNNIAITLGGIATIFSGVVVTLASQWVFAVFFGICIACFSALRSIIAVELIGLEKLTNAFGFLMLFQGLAAAIGAPIASVLYSATQSYDMAFYFAGGLILISAFFCYPLTWVNNWEKQRNERRAVALGGAPPRA